MIQHMIFIYLLQLGFHPLAIVGKIVQKQERDKLYTKGETIDKTIKKHGMHKIENKTYKPSKQTQKNIKKNIIRVISK